MAAKYVGSFQVVKQRFSYFLVLDFEATCNRGKEGAPDPQEIIEFPVLKVNSSTFEVESVFHKYVRPTAHPNLSSFCTELTGIVQDMVVGQPTLSEVLTDFHRWLSDESLLINENDFLFITCGDWDLNKMLPGQCAHFKIPMSPYFHRYCNIKKLYVQTTGVYCRGMMEMLNGLGVRHQGRHHSGIDDCRNIAVILKELAKRGALVMPTRKPTASRQF